MDKFINLTPHTVVIATAKDVTYYEPSGVVAQVIEQRVKNECPIYLNSGFEVFDIVSSQTEGLPSQEENVFFFVSDRVLAENINRADLISPRNTPLDTRQSGVSIHYLF